jgi:uncharacterized C2H2 Zn-finger protein
MEGNFELCCRLCLKQNALLSSVFLIENEYQVVDMIRELFLIEIYRHDLLSKEICFECLEIITNAHKLRLKSQQNDRIMRESVLSQDFKIKEEADELIKYEPMPSPDEHYEESFELEMFVAEDTEEYLRCDRCPEVRANKQEMCVHMQHDHLNCCSICSKQCSSHGALKQHVHRVHFKEYIPCDLCKMSFTSKSKWDRHKKVHSHYDEVVGDDNQVSYKCVAEGCKKVYDFYSEKLFDHMKAHRKSGKEAGKVKRNYTSGDQSLVCPHCGQIYKSKQILQQHIKRHFESGDRYACPKCPQKFKSW